MWTWKYIITALPSSEYSTQTRTIWSKHLKMGKYYINNHTINVTMYLNKNKLSKYVNRRTVHMFTHSPRKQMQSTSSNLSSKNRVKHTSQLLSSGFCHCRLSFWLLDGFRGAMAPSASGKRSWYRSRRRYFTVTRLPVHKHQ